MRWRVASETIALRLSEQPRVVIRGAAEHHAVDVVEFARDRRVRRDAAVDDDGQLGKVAFEAMHEVVFQRRYLAVLLRRQPLEDGVARMHHEDAAPGRGNSTDEVAHEGVFVDRVYANAVLDRDR